MDTSTFPATLASLQRTDAARPLVTFYDDATGERVELSVVTFANWVAKTCGLLQDELEACRGQLVLVDVPTHWQGAVWLGAAWSCGLCVTTDQELVSAADLVVCGPTGVERYAGSAADRPVVALSMRPLGGRFVEPLPVGVIDYNAVVLAQPDEFVADDPPTSTDAAWRDAKGTRTQAELLEAAAAARWPQRLLTDLNPCSREGADAVLTALSGKGSLVIVANPDEATWDTRFEQERATGQLRRPRSS